MSFFHHIKNDIVRSAAFGEILPGVIDHVVGADRAQHIQFPCAVHGGHFGALV